MRRQTELSSCLREMVKGGHSWGTDATYESTAVGGDNRMLPSALAVLAAAESRFMFFLVKLSGCRDHVKEDSDVTEAHAS